MMRIPATIALPHPFGRANPAKDGKSTPEVLVAILAAQLNRILTDVYRLGPKGLLGHGHCLGARLAKVRQWLA